MAYNRGRVKFLRGYSKGSPKGRVAKGESTTRPPRKESQTSIGLQEITDLDWNLPRYLVALIFL